VAGASGRLGWPMAMAWVGVLLVLYAALALTAWRPRVSRATERWANPLIGLGSGAVAGVTGVAAVPFLPYMQSLDIDRHDLVQALGVMFVFIIGALTLALAVQGAFNLGNLLGALFALVPALARRWPGQQAPRAGIGRDVQAHLPDRHVRRWSAHGGGLAVDCAPCPFPTTKSRSAASPSCRSTVPQASATCSPSSTRTSRGRPRSTTISTSSTS